MQLHYLKLLTTENFIGESKGIGHIRQRKIIQRISRQRFQYVETKKQTNLRTWDYYRLSLQKCHKKFYGHLTSFKLTSVRHNIPSYFNFYTRIFQQDHSLSWESEILSRQYRKFSLLTHQMTIQTQPHLVRIKNI